MTGAECLDGTPYSVPEHHEASNDLLTILTTEAKVRDRLADVRRRLRAVNLSQELGQVQSAREIYESNALEGLGPDLSGTWDILTSEPAESMADKLDHQMLTDSIAGDADMRAVLGLHGARLLAQRLRDDAANGRPLTEADLRSLHKVICTGEDHAGRYKKWHVKIAGENAHEPHLPIDVNPAMYELTEWFRAPFQGSGVMRAAAVHAWLTHIHPFEDGNGRLARILANIALWQAGLPPAIVKHKSQRGEYLDALRHSDEGGDILPLTGLFIQTLWRYIKEVDRPAYLRRVFKDELRRRGESTYDWWSTTLTAFSEQLSAELALSGLRVHKLGELDQQSFGLLRDLDSTGNTWYRVIRDEQGREILMWFGYPSESIRQTLSKDLFMPALKFSVPHADFNHLQPYRLASPFELSGLQEVMIVPDVPPKVYAVRYGRLRVGRIEDAATEIAEALARSLRQGQINRRPRNQVR